MHATGGEENRWWVCASMQRSHRALGLISQFTVPRFGASRQGKEKWEVGKWQDVINNRIGDSME